MPAVSSISSTRSRGAMPAVGSSISSRLGSVGQRHRELDALQVAIGQHAAGPVGLGGHPDAFQQRHRLVAVQRRRAGGQKCEQAPVVREQRHLDVLGTVMEPKVSVIWKVRPTPSRQTRRGASPVTSLAQQPDAAGIRARAGRSAC